MVRCEQDKKDKKRKHDKVKIAKIVKPKKIKAGLTSEGQGIGKELAAELGDVPVQIVQEPQNIDKELSELGDQLVSGRYTVHPIRFQASPGSPEPAAGGPGLLVESTSGPGDGSGLPVGGFGVTEKKA